jgi:hypothetical protein
MGVAHEAGERGKWAALVVALMTEPDIKAAARRVGVSYATARRWLCKPAFQALLAESCRAVLSTSAARLQQLASKAVQALAESLDSPDPTIKVRAATAILDRATVAAELSGVLGKVDELERTLAELRRGSGTSQEPDR